MHKSYSILANYYDKLTQNDCDYDSWSQYLYQVATKHNVRDVVDIACGTGKMTALLAKRGLRLTGIDASREMLTVAQGKCRANFVLQDMRKFTLTHAVDMACCVNDGVNYLKPSELVPFFQRVAAALKEGSPFLFDVSSPYKLREVIGNNVFYSDCDTETLLWSNQLKGDSVSMNITLFCSDGNGMYSRSDERHVQYVHTPETVEQCLVQAGFKLIETTAEYGKVIDSQSLRQCFYAVKK